MQAWFQKLFTNYALTASHYRIQHKLSNYTVLALPPYVNQQAMARQPNSKGTLTATVYAGEDNH